MDNFGNTINQHLVKIKDPLTLSKNPINIKHTNPALVTNQPKIPEDSFVISQQDIARIMETVKDNNITRLSDVNDIIHFKDAAGFDVDLLTDSQINRILSTIQENIETKLYSTIKANKIDLSHQESQLVKQVISQINQYSIKSPEDAVKLIKQSLGNNQHLLHKITPALNAITNNQPKQFNFKFNINKALTTNISVPSFISNANSFSSNVKNNIQNKLINNDLTLEAKKYMRSFFNKKEGPNTTVSSLFVPGSTLYEINKKINVPLINKLKLENPQWFNKNVLEKDANYLADVASKIAHNKSSSILNSMLLGEIAGTTIAAVGTATIVSAIPALGIAGAFALTIMVAMAGAMAGRIAGQEIGKVLSSNNEGGAMKEEYTDMLEGFFDRTTGTLEKEKKIKKQSLAFGELIPAIDFNTDSEQDKKDDNEGQEEEDKSAFNYIKKDAVETLKGVTFYNKNIPSNDLKDSK